MSVYVIQPKSSQKDIPLRNGDCHKTWLVGLYKVLLGTAETKLGVREPRIDDGSTIIDEYFNDDSIRSSDENI